MLLRPLLRHARLPKPTPLLSRSYAIEATQSKIKLAEVDPTKLTVEACHKPGEMLPEDQLVFGKTFTGSFFSFAPYGYPMLSIRHKISHPQFRIPSFKHL